MNLTWETEICSEWRW